MRDAGALCWLDPPPAAALAQARELLIGLDALDADGRITPAGRELARLPLHPRLAHMVCQARAMGSAALACDLAALLSEREVLIGDARRSVDLRERVEALAAFRAQGRAGAQHHGAEGDEGESQSGRQSVTVANRDDSENGDDPSEPMTGAAAQPVPPMRSWL